MAQPLNHPTISTDEVVRPTHVEVDLSRLSENFQSIRRHVSPAKIMPILKANAYGHGMVRIARAMEKLGADYIGVAVLEEALAGVRLEEKSIAAAVSRALESSDLHCPGLTAEDWVSAFLKLAFPQQC